jgi:hypothetical protein
LSWSSVSWVCTSSTAKCGVDRPGGGIGDKMPLSARAEMSPYATEQSRAVERSPVCLPSGTHPAAWSA